MVYNGQLCRSHSLCLFSLQRMNWHQICLAAHSSDFVDARDVYKFFSSDASFYFQLRSSYLRFVFFYLRWGNRKQRSLDGGNRKQIRPNQISTIKKSKPNFNGKYKQKKLN